MPIVVLQLPVIKRKTEIRLQKCRYCSGETFQRWGKVKKPVRDNRCRCVFVYRYRCCSCHRTLRQAQGRLFRHHPDGVDQADQTQRLRKLASLLWVIGLSLRGVFTALAAIGVSLSRMAVGQSRGSNLIKGE